MCAQFEKTLKSFSDEQYSDYVTALGYTLHDILTSVGILPSGVPAAEHFSSCTRR